MSEQDLNAIPPKVTVPTATPGAPRPITVRLKPITPVNAPISPAATVPATSPVVAAPDASMPAAMTPITPAGPISSLSTVKLRPVVPPVAAVEPMPPVVAAAPVIPTPPSVAQVQASKSKTSRISLDAAITNTPSIPISPENSVPKTIRLKRPTDLATPTVASAVAPITPASPKTATSPIRKTSRIPDSFIPAAEAEESATVTQKKTLRIKRPGAKEDATPDDLATASGSGEEFEGIQMLPVSGLEIPAESKGSKTFTLIATLVAGIAAILMMVLTWCLAADAVGPMPGKNAIASVPGPDLFWPGKHIE